MAEAQRENKAPRNERMQPAWRSATWRKLIDPGSERGLRVRIWPPPRSLPKDYRQGSPPVPGWSRYTGDAWLATWSQSTEVARRTSRRQQCGTPTWAARWRSHKLPWSFGLSSARAKLGGRERSLRKLGRWTDRNRHGPIGSLRALPHPGTKTFSSPRFWAMFHTLSRFYGARNETGERARRFSRSLDAT